MMRRSRHLDLTQAETFVTPGRHQHDRRRAQVEEQLALALGDGDREQRVSQLREQLEVDDDGA